MRKHDWLWAACIAGVAFCGCSDDSKKSDTEPEVRAVCGNGIVESPEVCDDGNEVAGDGCAGDCSVIESGYTCPEAGVACTKTDPDDPGTGPGPDPTIPGCGNGVLDEGEQCDDGNVLSFDGCSADCKVIESGYECTVAGELCVPIEIEDDVCGDGKVTGYETCDDGNSGDGDGCDQFCNVEYGWDCDETGCHTVCGDGIIMGLETCDDGNTEDGDGCKADCSALEEGFDCVDEIGKTYCKSQTCGSGIVNEGEACDYGEESASEDSKSYGWNSELGEPNCFFCQFTAYCGDGITNSGEDCDEGSLDENGKPVLKDTEGNPIGGQGTYGGCKADCKFAARCGDGNVDPGEECDNGKDNNDKAYNGCTLECKLGARCGDGIVQDEEVCDEGIVDQYGKLVGGNNEYGHCNADCSGYPSGFCGDGIWDRVNEQCDLGGYETNEDGTFKLDDKGNPIPKFVDENGYIVGGDGSYGGCNADCTNTAFCGDGNVDADAGEQCDEGRKIGDNTYVGGLGLYGGCNANCTVAPYCGDGIKDPNEQCDLGTANNIGGYDGCNADCTRSDYCGDGIVNGTEQCDNGVYGNVGNYEGCNSDCTRAAWCGDGITNGPEKCDKGEGNNTGEYGGCNPDCSLASYCGDGIVDEGEECDNAKLNNDTSYNGCTTQCKQGPRCGDDEVNGMEQCDNGAANNDSTYNGCTTACKWGPRCGDGIQNGTEQCDNGAANNDNKYNGCTTACVFGPRCGDGTKNGTELCDEGDKNGKVPYAGCTAECKFSSICGDGVVDTAYGEECDDGSLTSAGRPKLVDSDGNPMGGLGNYGGCNPGCTKAPYCGDGIVNGSEKCDDGNTVSGDGCELNCLAITPKWECKTNADGKSMCSKIPCGNGQIDEGEQCDDGLNPAECLNCKVRSGYMCLNGTPACPESYCSETLLCRPVSDLFGDGILTAEFEQCDDSNDIDDDGCTQGKVDPGYMCPNPGEHCVAKACGDGIKARGEECDDGNQIDDDGCSAHCKREEGYRCDVPGTPCVAGTCGDGIVQYGEECDSAGGVGCTKCKIDFNYECLTDGGACQPVTCGDGNPVASDGYTSYKECDDNNTNSGDGCSSTCKIETGYHCELVGGISVCDEGYCGNDIVDAGEECDDGNLLAGDGCDPVCKREIMFVCDEDGSCKPVCGDGITVWEAGEECDDGNLISGDGCSSECKREVGFKCTDYSKDYPATIQLPATYRDFRSYTNTATCKNAKPSSPIDGCIDSSHVALYGGTFVAGHGHPDFEHVNASAQNMVKTTLGADGLPVFNTAGSTGLTKNSFDMWYRDYPGINKTFKENLTLNLIDAATGTYQFNSSAFFPLSGRGYGNEMSGYADKNFHFTTHIQTYFKYRGNDEQLDFTGDDDVWVFVNGVRAIDLGGCHSAENGSFKLTGTTDPMTGKKYNSTYHLYENGIYSISFFQAERHTGASNFKLTLAGFLDMGTTTCASICGDGLVVGNEECDVEGHVDDGVARMLGCVECKKVPRCGNGIVEEGETCDSGFLCVGEYASVCSQHPEIEAHGCDTNCKNESCNDGRLDSWEECDCKDGSCLGLAAGQVCLDTCKISVCGDGYVDTSIGEECDLGESNGPNAGCMTTCKTPYCGDGIVTEFLGEVCDDGVNDGSYGGCGLGCAYASPYCGDAVVQAADGEECDEGINNSEAYAGCSPECKLGASCGDGIVNGYEECDDGVNNGAYGGCNADCTYAPRCGDGIVDSANGETCDNGVANDDSAYGGCSSTCRLNSYCGDGHLDSVYEACDKGTAHNTGGYGAGNCNDDCTLTSYCGDGILDSDNGEICDFGTEFNNGAYGGCTSTCQEAPYCGDGNTDSEYEQCDEGTDHNNGAYGGCTKFCMLASYCGDGILNAANGEECDNGTEYNTGAYGGCTSTCKKAPYCGDGFKNGEEDCDLGTANNTGAYDGCTKFCTYGPRCGDGIKNGDEICDYGSANNDTTYGGCTTACEFGPRCGDAEINGSEQCDDGPELNDGHYGGCTKYCTRAPYCGDGIVNGDELCDNGDSNADGVYGGCSTSCTLNEYCGDGIVNGTEACDLGAANNTGAYDGCTKNCELGPRCGDNIKNGDEICDNGVNNDDNAYNGCTTTCVLGPYCGDGIVNGAEQCDPKDPATSSGCLNSCKYEVN